MTAAVAGLPARRGRGDDGAYLVLYAMLGVAVLVIAALVLDASSWRQQRVADRLATDLAVAAGASHLDPAVPTSAVQACQAAWDYFVANATAASGTVTAPDCAGVMSGACDGSSARTAAGSAGDHQVEITHPVPDGSPLLDGEVLAGDRPQPIDTAIDGHPCERVAIRVRTTRPASLARVAGMGSATTDVHSVARIDTDIDPTQLTEMVVLDATGCGVLTTAGGGGTLLVQGSAQPSEIAVDTDASGCSGGYAIDVADADQLRVLSPGGVLGVVRSFALAGGDPGAAYDPADVGAGRLSPVPSPAPTRTSLVPADLRWGAAITQLRAELGGSGMPLLYNGTPFTLWPAGCDVVAPVAVPAGNWYVDCPTFRVASQAFFGGGAVVFTGSVQVDAGGCLAIGESQCGGTVLIPTDSVVYLRAGDLQKTDTGQLWMTRTTVHLTGDATGTASGRLLVGPDFSGGTSVLAWTAPLAGPLEDLLLWAETGGAMDLGGQGTMVAEGSVVAPNSTLVLTARPGGTSVAAQLLVGRARLGGAATFTVAPLASRGVTDQVRTVRLLR